MNKLILRWSLIVVVALASPAFAGTFVQYASHARNYLPGEILVKFKPSIAAQAREATVAAMSNTIQSELNQGWAHVKLGSGQTVTQALAAYRGNPTVEYAQPNYIYHAAAVPSDPQYAQLWAFKNNGQTVNSVVQGEGYIYTADNPGMPGDDMDIEPAWSHITDCSSVVVAVVDSGVNYNQQDLTSNMWNGGSSYPNHGWNYVDGNNNPMDLNGHGTHVAGIIGAAGNNSLGTTGVCWKASLMAVRVLDATGIGSDATIIQGINFAVAHGAKVINMSLGGAGAFDQAFSDAITNAQNNDDVVVVAAGNDGVDNDASGNAHYPCDFTQPNLICVAALDQSYQLPSFSDWGATSVDVGAPGTNILSTFAGSSTVTPPDSFTVGWTMTTTTSGGWVPGTFTGSGVPVLTDPSTWSSGRYALNTDDRAYKSFNLGGVNVATMSISSYVNVTPDGRFAVADSVTGGDPFAAVTPAYLFGTPTYTDSTPASSPTGYPQFTTDISSCISTTCTIGFQLKTGATADLGVALYGFTVQTLTLNTNSYNTLNGTSMASPEVAGLAAMLRAYNPQDTYADVVQAIEKGGRSTASLAGKTSTGNAVDVMSSLAYVAPPTGLTATVQ